MNQSPASHIKTWKVDTLKHTHTEKSHTRKHIDTLTHTHIHTETHTHTHSHTNDTLHPHEIT